MNSTLIDRIADAVLYEGYILYPYRPSTKNRQRWTFGGVYPCRWCEDAKSGDKAAVGTQCLLSADDSARVSLKLRFLHLMSREVRRLAEPLDDWSEDQQPVGEVVDCLKIGSQSWYTWQEATDASIEIEATSLAELADQAIERRFELPAAQWVEPIHQVDRRIVGMLVRRREAVTGTIDLAAERIDTDLWRISTLVTNETPCADGTRWSRDEALMRSLVSAHVVLGVDRGSFVSLFDPPETLRTQVASCTHDGLWPVLVGEVGSTDALLAAPIILYDYPQIAPESVGDLFDATEIDEILSLRILTLSDDEKDAVRSVDARARAMLERTEALDEERITAMHGKVRELRTIEERN